MSPADIVCCKFSRQENIYPTRMFLSNTYVLIQHVFSLIVGPRREKSCLRGYSNNEGVDQPAHQRSLISAFVIRFLKNAICKLAIGEISIFYLVSVAEETGLKLALSETPKKGFVASRPISTNNKQLYSAPTYN